MLKQKKQTRRPVAPQVPLAAQLVQAPDPREEQKKPAVSYEELQMLLDRKHAMKQQLATKKEKIVRAMQAKFNHRIQKNCGMDQNEADPFQHFTTGTKSASNQSFKVTRWDLETQMLFNSAIAVVGVDTAKVKKTNGTFALMETSALLTKLNAALF
jgi:hypothetical protein